MPQLNAGDTAWMLVSTALVLFMTPGLAFFYGGMVRSKNVLGMLMQNYFAMGLLAVLWSLLGFSLAFGGFGNAGFIGDFSFFGMENVTGAVVHLGEGSSYGPLALTIPLVLFCAYQMTFAIITPALITGATADRMRFAAYAVFIGLWLILVYAPVAHWVFGGGWIAKMGALDFAGGAVVHINAGIAALVLAVLLGRRKGWPGEHLAPHSLPWTLLGTGILWVGWAGFNAGSALAANGIAAQAIWNTFVAASAAMLGWLVVERLKDGHATTLGAASGAVAGLVAITPCAGYVGGISPMLIGFITGGACFLAISLKYRIGYDDSLDVVGVHLVGGLLGSLLLGLFASKAINPAGFDGLFHGGGVELLWHQFVASAAVLAFSGVMTLILGKLIDVTIGLRVSEDDEMMGLDLTQHAESAYTT
jgi:Amt family ammonium transporter